MNYEKLKENALKSNLVKNAKFVGKYDFPMLKKTTKIPNKAIPFDRLNASTDCKQWVHFYIDDYKFERIWNNLDKYIQTFKKFYGIIGTDFSTYMDMPLAQQIWNLYRNRVISHFLQENGIDVIPNVQWGTEETYEYCFDGIPSGGTVAISTNGCIKDKLNRYYFQKGLEKMVEVLQPTTIVNYSYMPDDIFGKYKDCGINFVHLENYNNIAKSRCCGNG